MEPSINKISNDNDKLLFTISGIKVCFVNALRRTILSDIDINICNTELDANNQCNIEKNTTRFHNEIIKQRLSCIPIHSVELNVLPGNYQLEVNVVNDTDDVKFVTTEDFRIKSKITNNYLTRNEVLKIYPPSKISGKYIDFLRLRPKISDTIKGEAIKLTCDYSIGNSNMNSMFNVVSICSYGNTIDLEKANAEWLKLEQLLKTQDSLTDSEIVFEKKNFYALDAQRHYINNSFDFVVETVGVYENKDIILKGCIAMKDRLNNVIKNLDSDDVLITTGDFALANAFNLSFKDEDYTVGKIIEDIMYEKHFIQDKSVTFCAFKKIHPHDTLSVLKLAFIMEVDSNYVRQLVRTGIVESIEVYDKIYNLFK